jgi:NADPH2:quinone reductase
MRAIQTARLDGPRATEVVEIAEPAVTARSSSTNTPRAWRFRMHCNRGGSTSTSRRFPTPRGARRRGDRVCELTMLYQAMAKVVALQPDPVIKLPDSLS